jgi:amidase
MKSGELTSRKITEMYIARIKAIDPKLNSVLEINPDALALADKADKERKKGKVRSALHGIPVLIKDNIDTADRMKTTAGSLALVDAPTPERDAFIVKQMRDAGAVLLGKTNLSEWANFRSTKSISGWSGRGGQCNNPYYLDQNPCGSSAGTGVAISANLGAVGIGTETNGSIICPSVRNGVVGIKPTLGLVSRSGIIPIAHTQDTAGPMARTVADAAAFLTVIASRDKRDPVTSKSKREDYSKYLDAGGLKGARLGVLRGFVGRNEEVKKIMDAHFDAVEKAGAVLVDVEIDRPETYSKDTYDVLLYEFKTDLNKYLAARGGKYRTLADLIKFNEENKEKEMPLFGQEIFKESQAKGELTDKDYLDALARIKKAAREDGIDKAINGEKLDAIFSPTTGRAWGFAAVAGYPSITVPAGLLEGMPLGVLFIGQPYTESKLIKYAYAFEQMTKARRKPEFIPKKPEAKQ